jgi:hypothetical protein
VDEATRQKDRSNLWKKEVRTAQYVRKKQHGKTIPSALSVQSAADLLTWGNGLPTITVFRERIKVRKETRKVKNNYDKVDNFSKIYYNSTKEAEVGIGSLCWEFGSRRKIKTFPISVGK